MRGFRNAALGLLGAAALAVASDVHDLTKDTFPSFIKEHNLVLAECGHCKALAPEYEEAATQLKEKDIPLAKVDCTKETELCQEYGIEGFPTVKVFRGPDNISPYSGQRKAQAIVSYMIKQSLPTVTTVTKENIEEFKVADKVVLVAYFDAEDKAANESFSAVAEAHRDAFLFGATNDASLAKAEGVKQPGIVLYKQFDEGKSVFDGKFEKAAIEQFANTASIPLIGEIGPETYAGYMTAGIPLAYIFAETPEERTQLAEELKPVAIKHKGAVNFATIDAKAFGLHAGNLNLPVDKFPSFAIQETVKNQKFPFDPSEKLSQKAIGKFVQDFVDGKVEPSIKSEPIPEKQEGPVVTVVAHNYEEIVFDNDKDVLLEFYAPWCGHCKALAPKYEELAALYFNNAEYSKKVVVAKVDATNNDVPDEIVGFPTIKLFPAGAKDSPVSYSGSRTVEDMANFIKENGNNKVDAYSPAAEEDTVMPDAETMARQAPAATEESSESATEKKEKATETASEASEGVKESVKSKVSEATEAVKTAVSADSEGGYDHDEL
ncbi:prolyl 4-hydroxylase, beta polypeptide [Xylona heveae TC161]|uniref:Protein disulfide-isomerase n=1 Tax=Xylona heveae (strain CBS 132557 / TC161) TaxID=1328760 RepID=A0A165GME8_XYLHT|nr:prolyl 4-hydroxylase, beta polypeptide [Xylona heveae TC161]KZF22369.1 prolyl 4-hydroxylase, beta polypeptide [Xylona heveae TC161]